MKERKVSNLTPESSESQRDNQNRRFLWPARDLYHLWGKRQLFLQKRRDRLAKQRRHCEQKTIGSCDFLNFVLTEEGNAVALVMVMMMMMRIDADVEEHGVVESP